MANAAKSIPWDAILGWVGQTAGACWDAMATVAPLFTAVYNCILGVANAVLAMGQWAVGIFQTIFDTIVKIVQPALNALSSGLTAVQGWIKNFEKATLGGIFSSIDAIQNQWRGLTQQIGDITTRLAGIIGLVDKDLADRLVAFETRITTGMTQTLFGWYNALQQQLVDLNTTINQQINNLQNIVNTVNTNIYNVDSTLGALVKPTIQAPHLFSVETINTTGSIYGQQLYDQIVGQRIDDTAAGMPPPAPPKPDNAILQPLIDEILGAILGNPHAIETILNIEVNTIKQFI